MTGGGEGFTERGGFIGGGEKGRRRLTGGGGRLIGGGERGQGTPSHMCIYARPSSHCELPGQSMR